MKNHLKDETSPYLLQHAKNPVEWYPWGEEAFERAKQEAEKRAALASGEAEARRIEAQGRADAVTIEAQAQAAANKEIAKSLTPHLLQMQQIEVQGKFNEALRENKDAKIFLTPGGSTPNIWVDTKDKNRDTAINQK